MEEYLDANAPQWVDFTKSFNPQVTSDFFAKIRAVEEKSFEFTSKDAKNIQPVSQEDVSCSDAIAKMQQDLNIIKSTPIKKVSPNRHSEEVAVTGITYDQVFSDAMRTLEFCKRPSKNRDTSNRNNQEPNAFKTPGVSKIAKSCRAIDFPNTPNKRVQSNQDAMSKSAKINKDRYCDTVNMRRTLPSHYLFEQNYAFVKSDAFKVSNVCSLDDTKDEERDKELNEDSERLKEENAKDINEENNDEFENDADNKEQRDHESEESPIDSEKENNQDGADTAVQRTAEQRQSNKYPSILTWQNHRRSIYKRRTSTNNRQNIGDLAEAMCFQNETPKRFFTRSTKKINMSASIILPKLTHNRRRMPTSSPTLVSKTGACAVTALSQEEREKPKEMRKHRTKAIPPRVPRIVPKAARKPTDTCSATQSESGETARATGLPRDKNPPPAARRDKASSGPKSTVPKITVTDTEGIVVEQQKISFFGMSKENSVTKNVTRVQPFSFEARNKDLQMKKEQRLKSLQKTDCKIKFHARPMPNFSKPPTYASRSRQNVNPSKTVNKNTRGETENAACAIDKRKASLKKKTHPPELNTEERLKRKEMTEKTEKRIKSDRRNT